ncbi:hypothetical protein BOA8489_00590 [Boseongicola aestuarii]|uniref:Uncharacterized protein n=1 Tax=Boseongicola aestuarii TaxID=1470561 RepID=A0A238IWS3_9RHOB|nr:hypothetical protein BOA8489_00590 [Boseongicola aestuarii]
MKSSMHTIRKNRAAIDRHQRNISDFIYNGDVNEWFGNLFASSRLNTPLHLSPCGGVFLSVDLSRVRHQEVAFPQEAQGNRPPFSTLAQYKKITGKCLGSILGGKPRGKLPKLSPNRHINKGYMDIGGGGVRRIYPINICFQILIYPYPNLIPHKIPRHHCRSANT